MPIVRQESPSKEPVKFDLRDVELILKHLMNSEFRGSEVAQAHITLGKLRQVHSDLVEQGVEFHAG